jgi:BA14K-like protein
MTGYPFISRTARIEQSRSHVAHNLCARGNAFLSKQLGSIPLMESTMISLRVLSTVAAMTLVLPMAAPTASFAQAPHPGGAQVRGGGAPHMAAPRMGGGAPHMGGGGGVHMGGGAAAMGGGAPGPRFSGGGGGGVYRGGYDGGRRHDGGGGFIPGAVAGALVGGAIASQGYYGGPGYYAPGYYDDQSYQAYDDSSVAPAPGGDDSVAYCMQTYRSYDPQSGTYLGNDGYRHPCP